MHLAGSLARAEYRRAGSKLILTRTEVPAGYEDQGLEARLIRTALDYARDEDLVVVPICPLVVAFVREHPAYQPVVLPGFWL